MRRIGFVAPRFGPSVVGGSEAVSREIALGLAERGWQVEMLTTCAVDHYTWANALPWGTSVEEGITVHRFQTVPSASRVGFRTHQRIYADEPTTVDEQASWLSFPFRVPGLFSHLLRHGSAFDAVVFSPYLFWTTTVCLPLVAERAVVVPCLHDEVYARLPIIRPVLASPASVWFLSEPEHRLAHRLGPVAAHHRVTGAGVVPPGPVDPDGFRARYGIERPFVLYAGRREVDKGWWWLVDQFRDALVVDDPGVDLVTVGAGEIEIPKALAGRVIDLGFLATAERDNALAAADALIQPSLMESFSRSVMESWLVGTPVLAREGSEVVSWHCARSGGGRTFADASQLAGLLRDLRDKPEERTRMGELGQRYVTTTYSWPIVLDRMEADLAQLAERRASEVRSDGLTRASGGPETRPRSC
ncbi:MAG: glycosyltransferase family 4 protein [Acidimicrobiales bacterium]